jgi:uncharacterized protein (TIGR04255 family)
MMPEAMPSKISPPELYSNLPAAPIVEAVMHWLARASVTWEPDALKQTLAERLPEYPDVRLQHQHQIAIEAQAADSDDQHVTTHSRSWQGLRLQHATEPFVVQFTRDGLAFSRLKPYRDWESFEAEARRLWNVYLELAAPEIIERLGVRFINRIEAADRASLSAYLREPPCFSGLWPLASFLYQSQFDVPGDNLGINLVKTMQPPNANLTGLILDIDVFTRKPCACDDRAINDYLPKLRSLKNMVFFELLTPAAIETFKRG